MATKMPMRMPPVTSSPTELPADEAEEVVVNGVIMLGIAVDEVVIAARREDGTAEVPSVVDKIPPRVAEELIEVVDILTIMGGRC